MPYPVHPVCNLFPRLEGQELQNLYDDFAAHGVTVPAVVWRGQLIDGRHRQDWCQANGKELPVREFDGDEDAAIAVAVSLNLKRRHLTDSQRATIAVGALQLSQELAEGRRRANLKKGQKPSVFSEPPVGGSGNSAAKVAPIFDTSTRSVERAITVSRKAEPEVFEAVKEGKATLRDAEAVADLPPAKQRAAARKVAAGEARTLKQAAEADGEAKEPPTDLEGLPVPDCLAEVWAAQSDFDALQSIGKKAARIVASLRNRGFGDVLSKSDHDYARALEFAGRCARPGYVCPHCRGKQTCECKRCQDAYPFEKRKICGCCAGRGWLAVKDQQTRQAWSGKRGA